MIARILLNDFIEHGVPQPLPGEPYREYLERAGVMNLGYEYGEIVNPHQHDKQPPPVHTRRGRSSWRGKPLNAWSRSAATIALAATFREKVLAEVPGIGGHVPTNAFYRPSGGATNSAHREACAIDLTVSSKIAASTRKDFFRCAVRLWCELATPVDAPDKPGTLPMGLGLYTSRGHIMGFAVRSGVRVHLDAFAVAGSRSWQGIGAGFGRPHKIPGHGYYGLPVLLAYEQGLDVPSLRDL